MFEEYLGEAKAVYTITRHDVRGFKNALSDLPPKLHKALSWPHAYGSHQSNIGRGLPPLPTLNARTINEKYLSKLLSMFNWCVDGSVIPDNPADRN